MDTITHARDLFTDYRLRHPVVTTILGVTAILVALGLVRRHRRAQRSLAANLLWFWPVKFMAYTLVVAVVFSAAAIYLFPRGYRWVQAKWAAR